VFELLLKLGFNQARPWSESDYYLESHDKQLIGAVAAKIRSLRVRPSLTKEKVLNLLVKL
jgi:hypothetical protein